MHGDGESLIAAWAEPNLCVSATNQILRLRRSNCGHNADFSSGWMTLLQKGRIHHKDHKDHKEKQGFSSANPPRIFALSAVKCFLQGNHGCGPGGQIHLSRYAAYGNNIETQPENERGLAFQRGLFDQLLAETTGFEPATFGLTGQYANRYTTSPRKFAPKRSTTIDKRKNTIGHPGCQIDGFSKVYNHPLLPPSPPLSPHARSVCFIFP